MPRTDDDSPTADELARRIAAVEQRLISREVRVKRHVGAISRRVSVVTHPRAFLKSKFLKSNFLNTLAPVLMPLSGTVASWLVMRLLFGKKKKHRKPRHRSEQIDSLEPHQHKGKWLAFLSFLLPLLPTPLRAGLRPSAAAAMLDIGMPLVAGLMGGKAATEANAQTRPLPTMRSIDLSRYAGEWYEIARLPTSFEDECAGQPMALYSVEGDEVKVINRCAMPDGGERVAEGVARVAAGAKGNAKLQVSFLPQWLRWLPTGWADYWVLFVDEGYNVALVGEPTRKHLWILSRAPELDEDDRQALVSLAANRGFPVDKLVYSAAAVH